jgi:uncharacterized membrane protein YedE/YeeE
MGMTEWLIGGGLTVGVIFGFLAQRFRFCMVAGISNWILVKDRRQILAFAAVLLIGIGGTQLLELTNTVAIETSSYRKSQFDWFGLILGGLMFGVGASLAGGCAVRTLVKTAEGKLHSLVVLLVFMVFAAITQYEFLMGPRVTLTNATAVNLSTDTGLASVLHISPWIILILVLAALGLYLYRFRGEMDRKMVLAGAGIGLLVVASWYITGVLAYDEFDPIKPSGITVSGPMARIGDMLITGAVPDFSFVIAFAIGVFVASLGSAVLNKEFKVTPIAKDMWLYAILGGTLMGIGAILAYGCNVGQGLTGISTLSISSILAFASMGIGTWLGLKWWGSRG